MRDLVNDLEFLGRRGGVAAADHGDRTGGGGLGDRLGHGLGRTSELIELEHPGRAVPDDGPGPADHLGEKVDRLRAGIEAHPAGGNALVVGDQHGVRPHIKRLRSGFRGGVLGENHRGQLRIRAKEVDRQRDPDVPDRGLGKQFLRNLGSLGIIQTVADRHALQFLLEGKGHPAANDDLVGLLEEAVDERNLVGDLRAAEDGEQRALRVFHHRHERLEFRLHQEAGHFLRKLHADHRRMRPMRGAESVVDEDVAEPREAGAEGLDRLGIRFHRGAVLVLDLSLLLNVKAEVFEEHHVARFQGAGRAGFLHLRAGAIRQELHRAAQQLLKFRGDGLEAELGDHLAIGPAEVGHEHHGRAVVERILDGRQGGHDALGIGDGTGRFVLRDVKVDADEDAFTGNIDIADGLVGGHGNEDER